MTLDLEVLVLLGAIKASPPYFSYIFKTLAFLTLPAGEMAIKDGETCIIIIKANRDTTLVSTLSSQTSLHFRCAYMVDMMLVIISSEHNHKAAYHSLFPEANILFSFAK
jgi:hypothetical protein